MIMKQRRYILMFGLLGSAAIVGAFFFFSPGGASALNPNHVSCSTCHNLHSAPGQALSSEAVVETLCLSCHGPAGIATKKAEVHTNKAGGSYSFTMTCTDCHNPHDNEMNDLGGTNLSHVGKPLSANNGYAAINTPNSGMRDVVFESRGTGDSSPSLHSFADGDEDGNGRYDGACEVCHTLAGHHRNSAVGDHEHYKGETCTGCHPHDGNFLPTGGGSCDSCHSAIFNGDFTQTSHHVKDGTGVAPEDCAVCHMEPGTGHMDGDVDLKNPDTGGALSATIPKGGVRDTGVYPPAGWVTVLQDEFCFKCHDGDGALSAASPMQPFSSGNTVPNVFTQFAATNGFHHGVRAPVNNSFCDSTTLEPPFDTASNIQITCFDCHETTGHGSAYQRMLRTQIDLDSMAGGTLSTAIGDAVETYCTLCHKYSVYGSGGGGGAAFSKFEFHGSDQNQHGSAGGNELGCLGCHGGIYNHGGVSDNGASRGVIHGGGFQWLSDSWAEGSSSRHFIVGGWISGWKADTSSGKDGCGGGTCSHPGATRRNTPGKEYTQTTD